jgi:hypothetical protein
VLRDVHLADTAKEKTLCELEAVAVLFVTRRGFFRDRNPLLPLIELIGGNKSIDLPLQAQANYSNVDFVVCILRKWSRT